MLISPTYKLVTSSHQSQLRKLNQIIRAFSVISKKCSRKGGILDLSPFCVRPSSMRLTIFNMLLSLFLSPFLFSTTLVELLQDENAFLQKFLSVSLPLIYDIIKGDKEREIVCCALECLNEILKEMGSGMR